MNLASVEHSTQESLTAFKELVPKEISVFDGERLIPKTPYLLLCFRGMILNRAIDLSGGALEAFSANRFVPAALLIRAVMESTALMHYVGELLSKEVDKSDLKGAHRVLGRAMIGSKFDFKKFEKFIGVVDVKEEIKPYQILDAIDAVALKRSDYRMHYEALSEYAHPNHEGAWGAYAVTDTSSMKFDSTRFALESRVYILQALELSLLVGIASFHGLEAQKFSLIELSIADLLEKDREST